jgi:hypothetical protein
MATEGGLRTNSTQARPMSAPRHKASSEHALAFTEDRKFLNQAWQAPNIETVRGNGRSLAVEPARFVFPGQALRYCSCASNSQT